MEEDKIRKKNKNNTLHTPLVLLGANASTSD
jgi:hypothetical protein